MFKNLFKLPKYYIRDAGAQKRYKFYSFDDMRDGFEKLTGKELDTFLRRNILEGYSVATGVGHDRWWVDVAGAYCATDKEIREEYLGDGYWDQDFEEESLERTATITEDEIDIDVCLGDYDDVTTATIWEVRFFTGSNWADTHTYKDEERARNVAQMFIDNDFTVGPHMELIFQF